MKITLGFMLSMALELFLVGIGIVMLNEHSMHESKAVLMFYVAWLIRRARKLEEARENKP